jgi:hypothetical protein
MGGWDGEGRWRRVRRDLRRRVFLELAGLKGVKWHEQFGRFGDVGGLRLLELIRLLF